MEQHLKWMKDNVNYRGRRCLLNAQPYPAWPPPSHKYTLTTLPLCSLLHKHNLSCLLSTTQFPNRARPPFTHYFQDHSLAPPAGRSLKHTTQHSAHHSCLRPCPPQLLPSSHASLTPSPVHCSPASLLSLFALSTSRPPPTHTHSHTAPTLAFPAH